MTVDPAKAVDPANDRLRRSYLRLMRAYPRWHRHERGAELLTTLLDDARPGQRRATRRDVADLVLSGLRARFKPPARVVGYMAAVVMSAYLGLAGAAAAVQLTDYPGPPTEAQAIAAARSAMPQEPRNLPGPPVECDLICPDWDGRDDVVSFEAPPDRTDRVVIWYRPEEAAPAARLDQARERLLAAGWQVDQVQDRTSEIPYLDASNGRIKLLLSASETAPGTRDVTVVVSKWHSPVAMAALVAGLAGGMLIGWLVAVWLLQRARLHRRPMRIKMFLAALPGLGVAAMTLTMSLPLIAAVSLDDSVPKNVQIPLFLLTVLPAWVITVPSALVTFVLAALPSGSTAAMHPAAVTASPTPA